MSRQSKSTTQPPASVTVLTNLWHLRVHRSRSGIQSSARVAVQKYSSVSRMSISTTAAAGNFYQNWHFFNRERSNHVLLKQVYMTQYYTFLFNYELFYLVLVLN